MALELRTNGHTYNWVEIESICKNWRNSSDEIYRTEEVIEFVAACIDNLQQGDPEAILIYDYRDSFTLDEKEFII